jgi:hypothetical protein
MKFGSEGICPRMQLRRSTEIFVHKQTDFFSSLLNCGTSARHHLQPRLSGRGFFAHARNRRTWLDRLANVTATLNRMMAHA